MIQQLFQSLKGITLNQACSFFVARSPKAASSSLPAGQVALLVSEKIRGGQNWLELKLPNRQKGFILKDRSKYKTWEYVKNVGPRIEVFDSPAMITRVDIIWPNDQFHFVDHIGATGIVYFKHRYGFTPHTSWLLQEAFDFDIQTVIGGLGIAIILPSVTIAMLNGGSSILAIFVALLLGTATLVILALLWFIIKQIQKRI